MSAELNGSSLARITGKEVGLKIPNFKDPNLADTYMQLKKEIEEGGVKPSALSAASRQARQLMLISEKNNNYDDFGNFIGALDEAADKYRVEHPEAIGRPGILEVLYTSENMRLGEQVIQERILANRMALREEHVAQIWDEKIGSTSSKLASYGGWVALGGLALSSGPILAAGIVTYVAGYGVNKLAEEIIKYRRSRKSELKEAIS